MTKVEYTEDQRWWLVDGTNGLRFVKEAACTDTEAAANYPGTPFEVECVAGVGVRVGWELCLDTCEWEVFDDRQTAEAHVRTQYGRDPETAELLG